ncbi:hypothetical protein Nepgr_006979 [Nepenthes gracilis]|uniref:cysteine dioxygenase n=1 Tax=Nepenthes gracilis TaxID=150966 RepID=A0AAD3S6D3_NEPGR|nr:hypothetical protein Nepgr_006979 [Nepenthes gracilis]
MGIETSLVGQKGKEFCEFPKETTNPRLKKNRRRQRKQTMIQTVFETCKEVFSNGRTGFVPRPEDVERLRSVLDRLKPSDVGLSPDMRYFRAEETERTPVITYLHLHECEKFSMGIFCLPPSGVLPLHNHPGMTVFSKLLFGAMHMKSYDWAIEKPCSSVSISGALQIEGKVAQLAKLQVDADFTAPCDTSILYPAAGGNMHCFTALTACAIVDVLGPPYSEPDGRHCTYYLEYPFDSFSVDGIAVPEDEKESYSWLQEREKPEDLAVVGAIYSGPKIVEV